MVNSSPQIQVFCTRPSCQHPVNIISEEYLTRNSIKQRFCGCCGMPLILGGHFLPLQLLVPDEQRGGFGRTFLAQDLSFPHRPLRVIKQLYPRASVSRSMLELIENKFQLEASILARFNHPQIPRAWAFFLVESPPDLQELTSAQGIGYRHNYFYLVQDYIEGQNLAQELERDGQFSGRDIIELLQQILPVLDYIHNLQTEQFQGVLHRDIKLSNIMRSHQKNNDGKNLLYLIDFGAVKQVVVAGVPSEPSCVLGTPDYAPPEQIAGRAVSASSDLYSLGATCVCLLTNRSAGELRSGDRWNWRQYAGVNENLARILDRMLLPYPKDRYQHAQDVKNELDVFFSVAATVLNPQLADPKTQRTTPPSAVLVSTEQASQQPGVRLINKKWGFLLLAVVVTLIAILVNFCYPQPSVNLACISDNLFSCGEKRLIDFKLEGKAKQLADEKARKQGKSALQEFAEGVQAFTIGLKGDKKAFAEAKSHFNNQLEIYRNDPETRIYLNNAKAAEYGSFVKVAVCVPEEGLAEQLLRGVAVVQEEINANTSLFKGKMLFLQICNDNGTKEDAVRVAEKLIQNQTIVGVIGHYTSSTTKRAGDIYNNQLVAISPTSTAARDDNYRLSNYVFRVSPDTSLAAQKLVDYIKYLQKINPSKYTPARVAVLYNNNPSEPDYYSVSMRKEFNKIIENNQQIRVVNECNLNDLGKNVPNCMSVAKNNQANFMLIVLQNDDLEKQNNASEISGNSKDMILLAGNGVYSAKGKLTSLIDKLIIAVQWIRNENPSSLSKLEKQANEIFGYSQQGVLINFRTAMAYDAAQAMVEAIKNVDKDINREKLYQSLRSNLAKFSATGANTEVKFDQRGDRKIDNNNKQKLMFLVTPKKSLNNSGELQFEEVKIN